MIKVLTSAEKIKAPDEAIFMKYFVARVFDPDFFVDTLAFNAREKKVQFKNTVLLRCFAGELEPFFETDFLGFS